MQDEKNSECCPKFDPSKWDGKTLEWKDKKFVKENVKTFMYIPLNFGGVMTKVDQQIRDAGAQMPDGLCLSDHSSKWKMDLLVAVDKEIPNTENVTLSGKYLCKVYESNFKDTGVWMKDFEKYAQGKNQKIKKQYMWYTTCPKCAREYGKNYVVIVGQID